MKLTNTWTTAAARMWAENATRALNISVEIGTASRSADAWLFCWESSSVLGLMGTRLAIGIRLEADLAVILATTPDDDGTELRTLASGAIAYGGELTEQVLRDHVDAMKNLDKMKRFMP